MHGVVNAVGAVGLALAPNLRDAGRTSHVLEPPCFPQGSLSTLPEEEWLGHA